MWVDSRYRRRGRRRRRLEGRKGRQRSCRNLGQRRRAVSRTSCRSDRPRGGGETTRRNQQVWTATCCRPHCIMGAGPAGVAQDDVTRLSRLLSWPSAAFVQSAQSEQEPGRLELRNQVLMVLNLPDGSERSLIRPY